MYLTISDWRKYLCTVLWNRGHLCATCWKRFRKFGPIPRIRRARAHADLQLFFADIADHDDHDNAGGAGLRSSVYTTPGLATGRAEILSGPEQAAPPSRRAPSSPVPSRRPTPFASVARRSPASSSPLARPTPRRPASHPQSMRGTFAYAILAASRAA